MGHVDHGKTTMLDWLRKSSVAAQEHGGITQHIGAFSVRLSTGKQITFLDTPGHAAFLTMRQRGANVTDIVILVVAADDSVKPQTLEALKHARAAKVPIIVAINKIDKDEARVDHVKADLARHGIEIEDFGGDVQVVCVSGKTGEGMNDLEENILTLSEILDVRAETDGMAEGWILEASIKPIGKVATVLVKRGTLRIGDYIVAGTTWAKVRVIRNEAGVDIEEAAPGTAVEILGWRGDPIAGDEVIQAPDESKAKIATHYREEIRDRESAVATKAAQEQQEREKAEKENTEDTPEPEESGTKIVNFIVKGDVVGSVEAVCAAIMEIGSNEVRPRVLRSSAGQVTESDVDHAATSKGMIISFNNPIAGFIKQRAKDAGVKILDYNVIYHLTDEVKDRLSDLLPPLISTRVVGEAEVLQVFPINLKGRVFKNIAGCRVRNGQISRTAKYRVLRSGENVFQGSLDSLKHGKKDVDEMKKGSECGISFEGWDDIRQGDQIQAYEETQEKRHL
ncbi:putative translation initiation factor if-2 protein [Phaeoacremonium minimum UCRPA7]|uniref:Translation initiation factor IF-2, mitochondrial n=1 Tax=Phaeoacremonium minimum (strain UCR-PA7) TaxID=1286976 RepID=R8BRP2_PHAM7|nr:putative translation initiation factor if-2 protein [Phaeoacremonium minimum UCRPA7]EOO02011.1 putative translation initiation factor if-2 protein [Phaeoacremonium minimum UCRPA7]